MMTDAAVRQIVRDKIATGSLPRDHIGAVFARHGANEVCGACSARVTSQQVLYTVSRTGAAGFVFHRECFGIWRDERNKMISAGPGVLD
jgi:hypothetical protein